MHLHTILSAFILSVGLAACGGSGSGDDVVSVDARTTDGGGAADAPGGGIDAPGGGSNALGMLCSPTVACPLGNMCPGVTGVGSQTMGWCTPMCSGQMSTECATGYTGPAGGRPVCILSQPGSTMATGCAIICTAPEQCPMNLACIPVPNQQTPFSICAPPA